MRPLPFTTTVVIFITCALQRLFLRVVVNLASKSSSTSPTPNTITSFSLWPLAAAHINCHCILSSPRVHTILRLVLQPIIHIVSLPELITLSSGAARFGFTLDSSWYNPLAPLSWNQAKQATCDAILSTVKVSLIPQSPMIALLFWCVRLACVWCRASCKRSSRTPLCDDNPQICLLASIGAIGGYWSHVILWKICWWFVIQRIAIPGIRPARYASRRIQTLSPWNLWGCKSHSQLTLVEWSITNLRTMAFKQSATIMLTDQDHQVEQVRLYHTPSIPI